MRHRHHRSPFGEGIPIAGDGNHPDRKMSMPIDPVAIARACYDAYVSKDRDAIERVIAPDFHFTSPIDNRIDRATYFGRCWPNSQNLEGFEFIHLFHAQGRVFATYVGRNQDGHRFQNTEILTVGNGQVTDVEVYFGWSLPHKAAEGHFVEESPN